ncbi:MAG: HU family DNA-binding protein, partial [Parabacteroides sp.]|nr:HU family DNA-binding protein [Parabacteroides sp.]
MSRQFLTAFEEVLTESLKEDSSVTLQGFGSFSPWQQSGRPARNPQNGTPCRIPPRPSGKIKPGKLLGEGRDE